MNIRKFLKLAILFGFLLAGIVGYYFLLYIPQRNLALHPITVENKIIDLNYSGKLSDDVFSKLGQKISSIEEVDMDKDGQKEYLVSLAGIGGNHPPQSAYVIKNKKIVASVDILVGNVYASKDGNGFYLKVGNFDNDSLCCAKKFRLYRIVYENGKYIPSWVKDGSY